jgi:hypothetical protein
MAKINTIFDIAVLNAFDRIQSKKDLNQRLVNLGSGSLAHFLIIPWEQVLMTGRKLKVLQTW